MRSWQKTAGAVAALAAFCLIGATPALAQDKPAETIVPLTDAVAPFLESRAFAASKGATAEFRKMEWVAHDPVNNKVYWAMTEIEKGMTDGKGDVQLEENKCGIVYAGDLDADNNVSKITPLIVGGPYDRNDKENPCSVDSIANPDNLMVDAKGRLWIGEDTSLHANNYLWMWDGSKLHRFAAEPKGAETTGLHITKDGTLFFSVQHPSGANPHPFNRGLIGVVNGFKATDDFTDLPVPQGADQHRVTVAAGEYQILGRAGELLPNEPTGARFGEISTVDGALMSICNHPDGNMFLPTDDSGKEGSLYTNFECIPGGASRIYIRNNGKTWDVIEGERVDFAPVQGTWNNCGSSVTPWNTAMTSEEYEPIATLDAWKENVAAMSKYLGKQANPYDYGYLVEMMPDKDGEGIGSLMQKHYAMGRFSHENGVVMPDSKTVYFGDDGTNTVFFKFVADEAGNLSAGTLYAAKATQEQDGSFKLDWIELGKGNDEEIGKAIAAIELPK